MRLVIPALPDWPLEPPWELSTEVSVERARYTGGLWPMMKLKDERLVISAKSDGRFVWVRAWKRADDPAGAKLKRQWPNLPKAVVRPYLAENILAIWRMTEVWNALRMMDAQRDAWRSYHEFRAKMKPRR